MMAAIGVTKTLRIARKIEVAEFLDPAQSKLNSGRIANKRFTVGIATIGRSGWASAARPGYRWHPIVGVNQRVVWLTNLDQHCGWEDERSISESKHPHQRLGSFASKIERFSSKRGPKPRPQLTSGSQVRVLAGEYFTVRLQARSDAILIDA